MSAENMKEYHKELQEALDDGFLQEAMNKLARDYPVGRARAFKEYDSKALIQHVAEIKDAAIKRMDELYAQFKEQAEKRGVIVHWAKTAHDANEIIANIAKENDCRHVIKSKSMTTEEILLNHALEAENLEVTETDLGEWIIQLRHEKPSHMVMPAVHLSKVQVSDLFSNVTGEKQGLDIGDLVRVARRQLRAKFAEADMGVTGANVAIAETGGIGIITNEGNARLCTTLPRVHVVVCGLDKLCSTMEDALSIVNVVPRNGTGQNISSYVTWVAGANECATAPGKEKVMHMIFLDNGRSAIAKDPALAEVLRCVRCGACANVCPVYRLVGGHKMGYIYTGAVGVVLTYLYHGHDKARTLAQNCINCEACKNVCGAGINLPKLIAEIRARLNEEDGSPIEGTLLSKVMGNRRLFHSLLRFAKFSQRPLTGGTAYVRHLPDMFAKGQGFRALPALAKKPFRDMWKSYSAKKPAQAKVNIMLFAGCAQDFIYPEQLAAAMEIFNAHNVNVMFPMDQTCCGLPLKMMGERTTAEAVALQNIKAFDTATCDYVVTLCASCASHMKHGYPDMVKQESMKLDTREFADKIIDFSSFCKNVLELEPQDFSRTDQDVTYHAPCHLCRGMGVTQEPLELVKGIGNYKEAEGYDSCCGFGGSYSVKFPELSKQILARKLANFEATQAKTLVTDCPGCILQLRGGTETNHSGLTVKHMAEFLAENMKKKA